MSVGNVTHFETLSTEVGHNEPRGL